MRKKDTTSVAEWGTQPSGPVTPLEVQQKEFRVARFGAGYRMREVDEFLDQLTDALSALTAENERLRGGAGDRAPAPSSPPSPPSNPPSADEGDRAAVNAFIRRERGFLQDLGGLVQAHAEELRSMVRAAQRDVVPPPSEAQPAGEPSSEPAPSHTDVSETMPDATPEAQAERSDEAPEEDSSGPEAVEAAQESVADDADDDPSEQPTPPMTTAVIVDEPIRLEDPQPARSKRSGEDEDGSLRELFWGEE
jgi:DivIVA domain-containing protein